MSYDLFVEAEVYADRKRLPGNIRQRFRRAIDNLSGNPRPSQSRELDIEDLDLPNELEVRRLRIENWRMLYAIHKQEKWVWVFGIRRRLPYDYEDLSDMVGRLN